MWYPIDMFHYMSKAEFVCFKHVMKHVIRIPHMCHIFFRKFVTLVSLKVPSGKGWLCFNPSYYPLPPPPTLSLPSPPFFSSSSSSS